MNNGNGRLRSVEQIGWVGRGAFISQVALEGGLCSTHTRHQILHLHLARDTNESLTIQGLTNMVPFYALTYSHTQVGISIIW